MFYFYLKECNSYDGIFFLFTNSSIFLFFLTYLKCLSLTPCKTKINHVWKYHLIFFFRYLIIDFFCPGGALRKELLYERSSTTLQFSFFFNIPYRYGSIKHKYGKPTSNFGRHHFTFCFITQSYKSR